MSAGSASVATGAPFLLEARTISNTSAGAEVFTRYTDIWARRDGRWICVSAQLTRSA